MYRSFTDRVLGGVCGGLGAYLHINAWWLRAAFVLLTILSSGVVVLLYIMLWWVLPQETLVKDRRIRTPGLALVTLLSALVLAAWLGRDMGWLRGPSGQDMFWPVLALLASGIFLLRQVRA
jgi:phage shock protein PspC (stress-responsive transcriptional regulator)